MTKRRPISQLPVINRTKTLERFFGSTVDHLFQSGRAEPISGFIGRVPEYNDASKDFYKVEPSAARQQYQLEAAMTSRAVDGSLADTMFYDDLIARMSAAGALVSDPHRLFASQYWSWAPPIDIDKINNSQRYFWSDRHVPALDLILPGMEIPASYTGNGTKTIFDLPQTLKKRRIALADQITVEGQLFDGCPKVLVNGVITPFTLVGNTVVLSTAPVAKAKVQVYRYGNIADGSRTTFPVPMMFESGTAASASQVHVYINGEEITAFTATTTEVTLNFAPPAGRHVTVTLFDSIKPRLAGATYDVSNLNQHGVEHVITGLKVRMVDPYTTFFPAVEPGFSTRPWDESRSGVYYCDGVGSAIRLTATEEFYDGPDAQYTVISRDDAAFSEHSRRNRWVHRNALVWCSGATNARQAKRPICEFASGLALFRYGKVRAPSVTRIVGVTYARPVLDFSQTIVDDFGREVHSADIVLFGPQAPAGLQNQFFNWPVIDSTTNAGFIPTSFAEAATGSVTRDVISGQEYQFDGSTWTLCTPAGDFPLFDLFDNEGVSLGDTSVYPGSDFTGSRIFGFKVADAGLNDPLLGYPIEHDTYGAIIFENHQYTDRFSHTGGDFIGFTYYAIGDKFSNQWHKAEGNLPAPDGREIVVPLNLQANPNFSTPEFISRNNWFKHFASIAANQVDFTGKEYTDNNWAETARDLSLGTEIVQPASPMLKLMLLMGENTFDFTKAVKFVESEYARFKLKVRQKIAERIKKGLTRSTSNPAEEAREVLRALVANKTADFAFNFSRVAGDRYFIPPTPAVLGILPLVKPYTTVESGVTFLVGHDGSKTASVDTITDGIVLAIENLIFENREEKLYDVDSLAIIDEFALTAGKYRSAPYSRLETNVLQQASFEEWARANNTDYQTNNHDPANPFTWNYGSLPDRDGQDIPGGWRGIYRWYFDTETPNLTPWEMLGFAERPLWWTARYGAAPYTRLNTQLWSDLSEGRITEGGRAGVDERFARPNLLEVLPVDSVGNLLDPVHARIVENSPPIQFAQESWVFGDGGPIENLWRRSSSRGFAKALALFLMRPAQFVEDYWDTDERLLVHGDQWIDIHTNDRAAANELLVHGEEDPEGNSKISFGIQNWIVEYMINQGQSPTLLGNLVRGLDVRLGHKMAGFTTTDRMTVTAENFGVLPDEDVQITLYQSPALSKDFYSGIIIEYLSPSRWRVLGYNPVDPNFDIIPSDRNGRKIALTGSDERIINEWRPNVYYKVGVYISLDGIVYEAVKNHTSSHVFESHYWEQDAVGVYAEERLYRYRDAYNARERVPYTTVFSTRQDVIDFLYSYERDLLARGFGFEEDSWNTAVGQFVNWSRVKWSKGSFLALSPGARSLTFKTPQGYVLNLEGPTAYGGIVNRTGHLIDERKTKVDRFEDELTITAVGDDIYGVSLRKAEVEHALIFSNTTIFGDIIYDPTLNVRQERLRVSGRRTTEWQGRYDAPGFIISNGQIVANFEKAAEDIRHMFDIELADNTVLRDHARHVIGFESREYLTRLQLNETQQFELYQGMIQQKGAAGSLSKILRSRAVEGNRDLRFLDEWAFRVGDFGPYHPRGYVEFALTSRELRRENQIIHLGDVIVSKSNIVTLSNDDPRWIEAPLDFTDLMMTGKPQHGLPDAGYIRTSEATYSAIDLATFTADAQQRLRDGLLFASGETVWFYNNGLAGWGVHHLADASLNGAENRVTLVDTADSLAAAVGTRFTTAADHGITTGDLVLINGPAGTNYDTAGVFTVMDHGDDWFEIDTDTVDQGQAYDYADMGEEGPVVFRLASARFTNKAAVGTFPIATALVYVDDAGDGKWAVFRANNISTAVRSEPPMVDATKIASTLLYDRTTAITGELIQPQPTTLAKITTVDPMQGVVAGIADKEIDFKLEYDPAVYDDGETLWVSEQVGRLWWDMSKTWFLNPYTDVLTDGDQPRYLREIEYRAANWSRLAPGTSVSIYEWTRSLLSPDEFTTGKLHPSGAYTEVEEYDVQLGKDISVYYFWVENPTTVPANGIGRKLEAKACADIISNPSAAGIPWVAVLSERDMMVSSIRDYLTDDSTVLQILLQLTDQDEARPHQQWLLLRPEDANSQPTKALWNSLRDSLAGLDDNLAAVPSTSLHSTLRVGVERGQSMFAADKLTLARQTFTTMVNYQLARHNSGATSGLGDYLDKADTVNQYLQWSRLPGSRSNAALPASVFYDIATSDLIEFENLVNDTTYPGRRVLLDNRFSSTPSWSVWHRVGTSVVLVPTYQHTVESEDDLADLDVDSGDFVFVEADGRHNGYWTICRYNGTTFTVVQVQGYRTSDFWAYADWYAEGYEASFPPAITYADTAERNRREAPEVTNRLVKVLDDGSGYWKWTAYIDNQWRTVAHQQGTIRLSDKLLNSGSRELRVIFDVLLDHNLLTNAERNELWFTMVNFAHAHHDQVDWAFKTSFLSVVGYNELLLPAPVVRAETTNDIIAYVEEVKPYRVTVRDFSRSLTPKREDIRAVMTDFDKPVYYDSNQERYRVLDENRIDDVAIMQDGVWHHWLDDMSRARKIKTTIKFDRVWFNADEDSGAASRISSFYSPVAGMKPKDLNKLLDLEFKGTILDGMTFPTRTDAKLLAGSATSTGTDINGVGGFGLLDPRVAEDTPQELVRLGAHDVLLVRASDKWGSGAPRHYIETFDVSRETASTIELSIEAIARNVCVFFDGVRGIENVDYVFSQLDNRLTGVVVLRGAVRTKVVTVHAMGYAGHTTIIDQAYLVPETSGPVTLLVPNSVLEDGAPYSVEVTVNGRHIVSTLASINGVAQVTFMAQASDHVILTYYRSDAMAPTRLVITNLVNPSVGGADATFDLTARSQHLPYNSSMMVEANGERLAPPLMFWVDGQESAFLEQTAVAADLRIVDQAGVSITPTAVADNAYQNVDEIRAAAISDRVILWRQQVVFRDVDAVSRRYAVEHVNTGEFKIDDQTGQLTIHALNNGIAVRVLHWHNDVLMRPQTSTFAADSSGAYRVRTRALEATSWLTINGKRLVEDVDYSVVRSTVSALEGFDAVGFDDQAEMSYLIRNMPAGGEGAEVVITTFEGRQNTPARKWQHSTVMPDIVRLRKMTDARGQRPYTMEERAWATEATDLRREGGTLVQAITDTTATITIATNALDVPALMVAADPVMVPNAKANQPGVVWINGERIEYFKRTVSNGVVTLEKIRRATHGTPAQQHAVGDSVTVPHRLYFIPALPRLDISPVPTPNVANAPDVP